MDPQLNQPPAINLETVLARLREQVAKRREEGAYPPGLEEELEAELLRIITRPSVMLPFTDMRSVLEDRGRPPGVDPGRVAGATASGIPGGAVLHAAVARAVSHQTKGVLTQVQDISNALWEDLLILADVITWLKGRLDDRGALLGIVDALVERVAAYERVPAESSLGVAELTRRIERLEAAEAARNVRPWFGAGPPPDGLSVIEPGVAGPEVVWVAGFGVAGPGAIGANEGGPGPAGLDDAMAELAQGLEGCSPVMFLGPGALLAGVRRAGVDVSGPASRAVPEGRELGPLLELESSIDRSLGALIVAETLERLAPRHVLDLVRTSADKLRPGGHLVVRASNPRSLWGLAHGGSGRPDRSLVDPGWLELCVREAGFASVELAWGPPAPGGGVPTGEGTEVEAHRALLFGSLYYTIRAIR